MTTKEHIEALEAQCKILKGRIAELELQPGEDCIRMRETIQHEREWRHKAEAQLAEANARTNERDPQFDKEAEATLRLVAERDAAEARADAARDAKRITEELQLTTAAELDEANAQLAEAQREIERSHEIIVGQNEEIVKAKAERNEAAKRAGDYAEQVNQVIDRLTKAEARAEALIEANMRMHADIEIFEGAVERLRAGLEKVEWVSGWDLEGHKVIYCPWCNRIKGFGHTFGCARQLALAPEPAPTVESEVKE